MKGMDRESREFQYWIPFRYGLAFTFLSASCCARGEWAYGLAFKFLHHPLPVHGVRGFKVLLTLSLSWYLRCTSSWATFCAWGSRLEIQVFERPLSVRGVGGLRVRHLILFIDHLLTVGHLSFFIVHLLFVGHTVWHSSFWSPPFRAWRRWGHGLVFKFLQRPLSVREVYTNTFNHTAYYLPYKSN